MKTENEVLNYFLERIVSSLPVMFLKYLTSDIIFCNLNKKMLFKSIFISLRDKIIFRKDYLPVARTVNSIRNKEFIMEF